MSKEIRIELKEELKCNGVELKVSVYPKGNSITEIVFQSFTTQRQKEGLWLTGQSLMWSVSWKWMSFEQGSSLQLKAISREGYRWEPSAATTLNTCGGRSTSIMKWYRQYTITPTRASAKKSSACLWAILGNHCFSSYKKKNQIYFKSLLKDDQRFYKSI